MSFRRIVILVGLVVSVSATPSRAQLSIVRGQVQRDSLEKRYRADFSVPDAPALDIVDGNPSNLLRPSTVREFALAASGFSTPGGDFRAPRAFSIEVAPFLLARAPRLSLQEYRRQPALYRFRVSGATGRDAQERASVAFGLRVALLDDGDLRTRDDYVVGITALTKKITALVTEERMARVEQGERPDPQNPLDLSDLTGNRPDRLDALLASIDSLRQAIEDRAWNARVLDVAVGTHARSADSLGNALRVTDYAAWATYGDGFGTWGQLLIGLKGFLVRDSGGGAFDPVGSLSARLFLGTNRYKAFAEGQVTLGKHADTTAWFLNAGGETRLSEAVWATFSAGLEWAGEENAGPQLASRFALKLALPDLAN